jgi:hypothetical protein
MNIWGNQVDLSMWPGGSSEGPDRPNGDRESDRLIVDHSPHIARYLTSLEKPKPRVDFILDNGGLELAFDLGLVDFLLTTQTAGIVHLHAKSHPTYVSDVTIRDVVDMLDFIGGASEACVRDLAGRLGEYLSKGVLEFGDDYFWTSPLAGWEMPSALYRELHSADLIISKGDANYRRWLGDRHWSHETQVKAIFSYFTVPLVTLRVLKANIIAGLSPGQSEALSQYDPDWLYNGLWGVIQFVNPVDTQIPRGRELRI